MIPLFCAFTFQRKCNESSVNQMHILLILWCRVLSNVHNSRIRYINCVLLIQLLIFYHSPVFYCPNHICTDICVLILLIMNTKWRQSRTKDNSSLLDAQLQTTKMCVSCHHDWQNLVLESSNLKTDQQREYVLVHSSSLVS